MSQITGVNGEKIVFNLDFTSIVNKNKGKKIHLSWLDKNNKNHVSSIIPRINPPKGQGALGLVLSPYQTVELSYNTPIQKILSGIVHPLNILFYSFQQLGNLSL